MDKRNEAFDAWLDEVYPEYAVAGVTLHASDILYNTDPIAYRVAEMDWEDDDDSL